MTSYTDEQVRSMAREVHNMHREFGSEHGHDLMINAAEMIEFLLADRTRLQAEVKTCIGVLKRYQDARVFSNPHTRQVARSIAEEIDSARSKKGDV